METQPTTSLFDVNLSLEAKSQLGESAKWARVLAICGMVFIALMILFAIIGSVAVSTAAKRNPYTRDSAAYETGAIAGMIIMYIIIGVLYFLPCYFTLLFANKMKLALLSNDEVLLSESLRNLKKTFRYLAVLAVIGLALITLAFITGGLGALFS